LMEPLSCWHKTPRSSTNLWRLGRFTNMDELLYGIAIR
jgi:hypothetical protein